MAFKVLYYSIPHALCFTVPWASLVSIMLVFGRLSADSEITAMRACGVSILQIVAPLIVTTILFTGICLELQFDVGPRAMLKARNLGEEVAVNHPLAIFTPGIPVALDQFMPGASLYFSDRDSENNIYNVQVYRVSDEGIQEDATAARGRIEVNKEKGILQIVLFDAQVETRNGGKDSRPIVGFMEEFRVDWNYAKQFNAGRLSMREKYLTARELLARTVIAKRQGQDTTPLEVELSMRVCLA